MVSAHRPRCQSELGDDLPRAAKIEIGAKKKGLVASERNNRKRAAFRRKIADWDAHQFVFVDEMGTNLSLTRLYGRAEPGVRVVEVVRERTGRELLDHWRLGA